MTTDLPLKCTCGKLRGTLHAVSPKRGNRLSCLCDDCQTYAHYLGRASEILDEYGGTDLYQTTPAQLTLSSGQEHLCCLRLSPKGLLRWYAGCCNTPIANTLHSAKVPFASVCHLFMDHTTDGRPRDEVLGPLRGRIQARFGHGKLPPDASPKAPARVILRSAASLLSGWVRGAQSPSPFFDSASKELVVTPYVLTLKERRAAQEKCAAG